MIKVQVIMPFTLGRFDELKNIERVAVDTPGKLYVGDKFECTKELADYLLGGNALEKAFVKVLEIVPEITPKKEEIKEEVIEEKPKKKKKSTK